MTDLIISTGFDNFDFGLSSAMAWIYFAVVMLILLITTYFVSKRVFYQE